MEKHSRFIRRNYPAILMSLGACVSAATLALTGNHFFSRPTDARAHVKTSNPRTLAAHNEGKMQGSPRGLSVDIELDREESKKSEYKVFKVALKSAKSGLVTMVLHPRENGEDLDLSSVHHPREEQKPNPNYKPPKGSRTSSMVRTLAHNENPKGDTSSDVDESSKQLIISGNYTTGFSTAGHNVPYYVEQYVPVEPGKTKYFTVQTLTDAEKYELEVSVHNLNKSQTATDSVTVIQK